MRMDLFVCLVSEMTYTVSSGTLNSSIPYHTYCLCVPILLCFPGQLSHLPYSFRR